MSQGRGIIERISTTLFNGVYIRLDGTSIPVVPIPFYGGTNTVGATIVDGVSSGGTLIGVQFRDTTVPYATLGKNLGFFGVQSSVGVFFGVDLANFILLQTGTCQYVSPAHSFVGPVALGGITTAADHIKINVAGKGLFIKEGSNAKMGSATLNNGTVTVSTTAVTASSRIFLQRTSTGSSSALGELVAETIIAGTSFVINSYNLLCAIETNDKSSVINWLIIESI